MGNGTTQFQSKYWHAIRGECAFSGSSSIQTALLYPNPEPYTLTLQVDCLQTVREASCNASTLESSFLNWSQWTKNIFVTTATRNVFVYATTSWNSILPSMFESSCGEGATKYWRQAGIEKNIALHLVFKDENLIYLRTSSEGNKARLIEISPTAARSTGWFWITPGGMEIWQPRNYTFVHKKTTR